MGLRRTVVPALAGTALLLVTGCSLPTAQPFGPAEPSVASSSGPAAEPIPTPSAPTSSAHTPTPAAVPTGYGGTGPVGAVPGLPVIPTAAPRPTTWGDSSLPTQPTATPTATPTPTPTARQPAPKRTAPRRAAQKPQAAPTPRRAAPVRPVRGRVVYLTFDDGPDPTWTPRVLALLARHRARATFFVMGEHVAAHPSLVRRERVSGNAVGNHTWDHPDLTTLSASAFAAEVGSTTRAIAAAGGGSTRCLRPPYGARDATVDARVRAAGLVEQLWSVDPQDWSRPGAAAIEHRVLSRVHPGSVVLMHDGGGDRSQTVAALSTILTTLAQRGYRFAALPCSS